MPNTPVDEPSKSLREFLSDAFPAYRTKRGKLDVQRLACALRDIRNLSNVLGKAMKHVPGWENSGGTTKKFGRQGQLWVREGHSPKGEVWVENPPDSDRDDMLE